MKTYTSFTYSFSILLAIIICLLGSSCEKLIEVDLPSDQLNTSDVYKNRSTTEAALLNLYVNIRENSIFTAKTTGSGYLLGTYCDELESFINDDEIYTNTLTPSSSRIANLWNSTYTNLYAINSFIEGVSNSNTLDTQTKQTFLAEAYFLRALNFQYLTQLYGDIALVTTSNYKTNSTMGKTNTIGVLSLVEQDLLKAIDGLNDSYRNPSRIFPNKATAELLLAKNYLLQKRYDLAQYHAQRVIDNPQYTIETDLLKVFKRNAKSTIWQLSPASATGSSMSSTYEAISYVLSSAPSTTVALSNNLMQSFTLTDLRRQLWIGSVSNNNQTFYYPYKYKNKSNNTDEYSIVFRIEEAYFILIEALAYQDQIEQAAILLNIIRQRAGLTPIALNLSKPDFIDQMLNESNREFFTETAHRFFDLKRNNKLPVLQLVKPNWQAKHQLLPIPEKETISNKNLLPQNNGY